MQGEEVDRSMKGAEKVCMCYLSVCVASVRKGRVKLLSIIVFSNSTVYNIRIFPEHIVFRNSHIF